MFKIIRSIIFIVLSLLIFIFNEAILDYLNYVVASAMFIICGFEIYEIIREKEIKERIANFVDALVIVLLGIMLLFLDTKENFAVICVVWCMWSFMREGREIGEEVFVKKGHWVLKGINIAESIIVIVFSILLIFDIGVHHAHTHVILLGFEFLFSAGLPLLEYLFDKKVEDDNKTND